MKYIQNGDYLIPDLTLNAQPATLGRYGRMRKKYLQEHRPVLWNRMLLSGTLDTHLQEIDTAANRRIEQTMPGLMKAAGVTENLKEQNPLLWTQQMNSLKAQIEEMILNELIFS
ncbi:MAG: TnpV protein [Clostridia bacterium]|nr:TnpV protein [Clostridia bacterium]